MTDRLYGGDIPGQVAGGVRQAGKSDPEGRQGGDKELLHLEFKFYRLHIDRSFTVFYQICEEEELVKILEIVTIDRAHKHYKHFEK